VKVGDLQKLDATEVKRRLGKAGVWVWEVANGLEREDVREHELKSLSTERTFEEDTQNWEDVERVVGALASELAVRVKSAHIVFRRVGVKIRFRGFETHTREAKLTAYSSDGNNIGKEAIFLLKPFRGKTEPVRLVGLRVSELRRESADQTSMVSWIEKKGEAQ
jgi:DNA polymerase IV (DinB-like DNA polymerase)